ncbi:hypothetical protein M5C72_06155 [Companilactobacillus allii]|uniref:Uncharacterized protein n=1 Tax=Companilactobacillus allii TaxID=1847728 RepID=A0A1P8Q496_9LACO|nr:hypothetical protein [Companilactobacillus allii]APX72690.1 hypothetical protein BTM29_09065 [Companilactobacillus allii]USQ69797.1 hypothetical protein M5C72_06155 [Companilactobacillus allii]
MNDFITFLKDVPLATYVSLLSLLISFSLALEKWFSYRTKIDIKQVQIVQLSDISFFMHFYITNKSSRTLGIYDLVLNSFRFNKHHHRFSKIIKDPDRNVWTSAFPVNVSPWEQQEILIEFVNKDNEQHIKDLLNKDGLVQIKTNRKAASFKIDLKSDSIKLRQAMKEW